VARGLGIRFAAEAAFIVVVAVVDVIADLRWPTIILTIGAAWILVSVLEWWLARPRVARPRAEAPAPPRRREPAAPPPVEAELPQHVRVITPEPVPVAVEPEPEPELSRCARPRW